MFSGLYANVRVPSVFVGFGASGQKSLADVAFAARSVGLSLQATATKVSRASAKQGDRRIDAAYRF
jgi:hypothetical protein